MRQFIKYLIFSVLISLVFISNAQEAKFYAQTDADKIFINSTVNVSYKIENLNASNFTPPPFNWFDVVSGPSRSTSTTIINGKVTKSNTLTYTLLSKKAGTFQLKPASIMVGGKKYETKPVSIEVIERDNSTLTSTGDKDFIVRMELTDTVAYVGQQVVLDYVLYNKVEISNYKLLNEPEYDGFFKTTLNESPRGARREIINGQEYYKRILKRVALYPQQTGNYTFGPVSVQIGIPEPGARRSFFFSQRVKYKNDIIPSKSLNVLSTPGSAPISFSGGVGQFVMQAKANKNQVSTDDAVLIVMEIKGDGDIRTVQAPEQSFGPDWEVYDPKLITENAQVEKGRRLMYKKYEYLIVPKRVGKLSVTPEFSYFNTEKGTFETVRTRPIVVTATKGTRTVTSDNREVVNTIELSPLLKEQTVYAYRNPLFSGPFHYTIYGLSIISVLGFFFVKKKRDEADNIDPLIKKKMRAKEEALAVLSKAKTYMDTGENKLFYEEVSKSLYGFLQDKYHLNSATLSLSDLVLNLSQVENIYSEQVSQAEEILKKCQQALYAASSEKDVSDLYQSAVELIETLS